MQRIVRDTWDHRVRYACNDGVAMTTPRDDIAGLSERLRRLARITRRAIETSKMVSPWSADSETLEEAATQLGSLIKEREALQARVKELEADMEYQARAHSKLVNELEEDRVCGWNLRREADRLRDLAKAAADTLRQERAALQARVKELESGIAHAQYRSDNCDAENQSLYNRLEAVESRALRAEQERDSLKVDCSAYASRNTNLINDLVLAGLARDAAEQERDEAYERLKPFAEASDSLDESHLDRMDLWESPSAMDITAGHLRAARDLVRRLAGTEKEGK